MRRRYLLLLTVLAWTAVMLSGSVGAAPTAQDALFETTVFDLRSDLELLATDVLGAGQRPADWTGNVDPASETAVADLWFDNEQLADVIFGVGTRPPDWFGAGGANRRTVARNVRHDLELSADEQYGVGNRPQEWRGGAPILRCSREVQNIADLLVRVYNTQLTTPESALDYCTVVEAEVTTLVIEQAYTPEQTAQIPDLTLAVRGDLERLADEALGLNNRPAGWIGNRDRTSQALVADIFLDLEALANELLGPNERPAGWIGGVSNNPTISYLNLRHDLELLADARLGFNERPNGWQGDDPALRCDPVVQNLVFLVTDNFGFTPTDLDPASPSYCATLLAQANQVAETPPVEDVVEAAEDERLSAESNYAFAYLDVAATQYMGIMPGGTEFRAWYRNFSDSGMMFVSGDDFALYVDYRFTTLPPLVFDSLPTLENVAPITFCDAAWCNGPGPTPTPTGFGPLAAVVNQATPPATVAAADVSVTKTQVSWNNIRVTYLSDNLEARTAQVALEICPQPAQSAATCEPVTSVTDTATNATIPAVSQYNTLNVYEFRYGYTTNVRIEGPTLFSNDIWISDPTIR